MPTKGDLDRVRLAMTFDLAAWSSVVQDNFCASESEDGKHKEKEVHRCLLYLFGG